MTGTEFKKLAKLRAKEARALFNAKRYAGAYYLAGYAVECALKACIAKQFRKYDIPSKSKVNDVYTHSFHQLLRIAGLEKEKNLLDRASALDVNWGIVGKWSENSRYETERSRQDALDICNAVEDQKDGVITWLKKYW